MLDTTDLRTSSLFKPLEKPEEAPRSKQPKSRPPAGIRKKILRTPLPYYSGPYSVGMLDIEIPVREPRTFSNIKRNGRHLLELETVLFSVFYPSAFGSGHGPSPEGKKKWSRATWLTRPRVEVSKGYGKFAGLPTWPTVGWFGKAFYHLTPIPEVDSFRRSFLSIEKLNVSIFLKLSTTKG